MAAPRESSSFGSGVTSWCEGLGKVRDAVRQELVTRQLAAYLRPPSEASRLRVLDVGCGQGTQALRLAWQGFDVTGVDLSDELLDVARRAAAGEPEEVADRIRFERGDLLALDPGLAGRFDVVCCQGELMYLPSLADGVAALVRAARPGGLISVLTRNRAGIAMRAAMSRDFSGALAGFEARYFRNRLGIDAVRADEPAEFAAALDAAGATRLTWYGVRLFSDHWTTAEVRTTSTSWWQQRKRLVAGIRTGCSPPSPTPWPPSRGASREQAEPTRPVASAPRSIWGRPRRRSQSEGDDERPK